MDRNVAIATVLIAVILFVWLWWLSPPPPAGPTLQERPTEEVPGVVEGEEVEPAEETPPVEADSLLAGVQQGEARQIVVDTDLYQAVFSSRGATLTSFILKEYTKFDQETPVQLVDTTGQGALSLVFTTPTNRVVDTRSLYFTPGFQGDTIRVTGEPVSLTFTAAIGDGSVQKTYVFQPGEYEVGLQVRQENAASFMTSEGYELAWNGGIPFTENDPEVEARATGAFARSGGEIENIGLDEEEHEEQRLAGDVSWAAVKNKYFTAVMIPSVATRGALLAGDRGENFREDYTASLMLPRPENGAHDYRLYIGPMEFFRISSYDLGLYGMVDYGWDSFEWVTRPFAQFIFIPVFEFLGNIFGNFGIVIIVFAILMKIVLYPLTKSSYESMARMRELQPKMEAIKEKYADDPQKQQEAIIRMYKETGINPLGGCLPMLAQYPVLIALWQFFPSALEIRQQSFLWANDLSAPDVILNLPFTIPLYGDFVAGFTLLMGLSLVVQMRLQSQPATNPQAKVFTYVMPVMLFLFFNRLASGLSLYYLVFNVLTAVQQKFINERMEKKHGAESTNGKSTRKEDALKAQRREKSGKRSKGART